ncbi:saccharopine dehydrogenase NADP-binding domain-containing protein [Brevundimonas diminuta]|uniref:saccharopine dehydrogenase family protein n=1 Tax=Brevundimonas diminuta TaxID=293 RepID=UPI002096FE08|nr:saccharopine dehydrogenase NADP-binding domain-containing protein [Brevundimonas diminuta]MCO8017866.1 saccharopine dehydrogenase NADP-binding domain-containing protein [Brevundimonas diminuta]MCO8021386.1 saccharopine dehydrogenase NADP-binding domain-containing protein [Brevundimonas diminuta]
MRVLFLGAGEMGAAAALASLNTPSLTSIVIADRDEPRALALANSLIPVAPFGVTIGTRAVDATDAASLRDALSDADVVMNAAGPFYRFGASVLQAAIETGTHYVDICDDWEPTLAMLELDAAAREAGVVALVGMGASPGASNLLAMLAVEGLDEVEDLYTCWGVKLDDENRSHPVSAATIHWIHQLAGDIRIADGGRLTDTQPLEGVQLDYPGVGRGVVYTVGHPEPVTLVNTVKASGRILNAMVMPTTVIAAIGTVRHDIQAGELTIEDGARALFNVDEARHARIVEALPALGEPGPLPHFFALATGRRNGQRVVSACRPATMPDGMARATGIPMSIGLRFILEQKGRPGVHAPEQVVDPRWFFEALAPHCVPPIEDAASMVMSSACMSHAKS